MTPSAGSIRLAGKDVSRLPASERARAGIGRTYQIPRPFLDMTVEENLEVAQYSIGLFAGVSVVRRDREALLARLQALPMSREPWRGCCRCCGASGWKSPARSR